MRIEMQVDIPNPSEIDECVEMLEVISVGMRNGLLSLGGLKAKGSGRVTGSAAVETTRYSSEPSSDDRTL